MFTPLEVSRRHLQSGRTPVRPSGPPFATSPPRTCTRASSPPYGQTSGVPTGAVLSPACRRIAVLAATDIDWRRRGFGEGGRRGRAADVPSWYRRQTIRDWPSAGRSHERRLLRVLQGEWRGRTGRESRQAGRGRTRAEHCGDRRKTRLRPGDPSMGRGSPREPGQCQCQCQCGFAVPGESEEKGQLGSTSPLPDTSSAITA